MLVGLRISPDRSPRLFVVLWLLVMLATCWIAWLAVLDAIASSRHFHSLGRERGAARERFKREFERILSEARKSVRDWQAEPETFPVTRMRCERQS